MGLYAITTRATGTVLTANIFNSDHQNHVTHTEPSSLNSHEQTLAQMQIETNPAPSDVPSLAVSLGNEFERIRYSLSSIKAAIQSGVFPAHWYTGMASLGNALTFAPAAARVEAQAPNSIPQNSSTAVTWDTTIYDTTGLMGQTSFSPRSVGITIVSTGNYLIGGFLGFGDGVSTGPTGNFQLSLQILNGVVGSFVATNGVFSSAFSDPKAITVETVVNCVAGQVVQLIVNQSSGSTKTPISVAGTRPALWAACIGH